MPARLWPLLALVLIATSGCASGIRGGKKYTRFAPDAVENIEPARHSGEHFIVVRMEGEKGLIRWPDTKRELTRGEPVGFKRDENGHLRAVAGNATRNLDPVPPGVAYIAWYYRDERPMNELAYAMRDGAGALAGEFLEAAVEGAIEGAIDSALGVDDRDDHDKRLKRYRRLRPVPTTSRSVPAHP